MARTELTRRALLKGGAAAAVGIGLPHRMKGRVNRPQVADPQTAAVVDRVPIFTEYRYGHMVQEYYVHRLREVVRRRAEERSAIRTSEQVLKLREEVRRKLAQCYGPHPDRTPLNAHTTGTLEREHYSIEKVIYESRPNLLVTANLYLPKKTAAKCPAVLGPCGHTLNGKAYGSYQEFSRNLARQGYVVLTYDPPSQGERVEYPDRDGADPIEWGVQSHNVAANQMSLIGRSFALWEAWDGIRGIDYLLSRPEVDATRIGVTGNSGGGTQTCHINALDNRLTMAAPNCFVTRFICNLENEEPTDAEQIIPGMLAAGLDMADFFIAQIPRPTLLSGEVNDFFDVRGLRETYEELRRLYAILGAEDRVDLYVGPTTHDFHKEARENMYRFFNRHAGVNASPAEPDEPLETDSTLQVTPKGQVYHLDSRRAYDFTREEAQVLARQRIRHAGALTGKALQEQISRYLALPQRSSPPHYRVMRARRLWDEPRLSQYGFAVETEPGVVVLLHAIVRDGAVYYFPEGEQATLYVPHRSALKEVILELAPRPSDQSIQFALDLRGMGQLTARTCKDEGDDFFHYYHSDYMYSNYGIMLNESYCGRRVHDLLRVLDLFQENGYRQIHLMGRGMGSISATFAANLHPIVNRVTLHNALLSYHELTHVPRYTWPLSSMVFGILETFDLPDCLRDIATTKDLTVVDPWDHQMRLWTKDKLDEHLGSFRLDGVKIRWT